MKVRAADIENFDTIDCTGETSIMADSDGTIKIVEDNMIYIEHDGEPIMSCYKNINNIMVYDGQEVKKDDVIGKDDDSFNYRRTLTVGGMSSNLGIPDDIVKSYREDLADYACNFVGNPYVWGGTSLTDGADCSGFVYTLFHMYGRDVPRGADAQYWNSVHISESELKKGDLIFYGPSVYDIHHVVIYLGDGRIVHASNSAPYPDGGIKITDSYLYETPCGFGRYE